ncbi:hypothetical protein L9F63_026433, partial [Diploptera punctata]
MYVVSTKPAGFNIEITNQDSSMVMTGVRIMLGTQDSQRAPSYVEKVFSKNLFHSLFSTIFLESLVTPEIIGWNE